MAHSQEIITLAESAEQLCAPRELCGATARFAIPTSSDVSPAGQLPGCTVEHVSRRPRKLVVHAEDQEEVDSRDSPGWSSRTRR
jgi:hypothetical protein